MSHNNETKLILFVIAISLKTQHRPSLRMECLKCRMSPPKLEPDFYTFNVTTFSPYSSRQRLQHITTCSLVFFFFFGGFRLAYSSQNYGPLPMFRKKIPIYAVLSTAQRRYHAVDLKKTLTFRLERQHDPEPFNMELENRAVNHKSTKGATTQPRTV